MDSVAASAEAVGASVIDLEKQYLLQNYARYPLVLTRGKGCYVYDASGKRYLDLIAGIGVNALGHAHPRLMKVIREQAARMIHCSNLYYHEYQGPLAERIAKASGLDRVFFCNSGTESVEGALKMIRSHGRKISTEKFETVALLDSFHGRTFGALSITGQENYRRDFEPMLPARDSPSAMTSLASSRPSERTPPESCWSWCRARAASIRLTLRSCARLASWRIVTMRCWCSMRRSAVWAAQVRTSRTSSMSQS